MKNKNIIAGCIFLTTGFFASSVQAQVPLPCGNYKINQAAEYNASKYLLQKPGQSLAVNHLVRVYFHIVTNDNGSNAPITTAQVATEFTTLQSTYAPDNICFLNAGTDSVKNTFLNTLFNADNDPEGTFFSPYQVPQCINVFYTQKINGNNTACNPPCGYGGIALGGIPGTFFLVSKGNIGAGSSVSHEMGHSFGLLHTFETSRGFEKIDGSNATFTGDLLADTPADPFAYNGKPCFVYGKNKCTFIGVCPDSNNAINYTPPYTNLMAYWWNGTDDKTGFTIDCYPNLITTNGQFARVNSFLGSYFPLIGCSSANDVLQTGISVTSGYYMNSAINTFSTSGSVSFTGSTKATIGGGRVQLQNGFRASPAGAGIVRIEARPCN